MCDTKIQVIAFVALSRSVLLGEISSQQRIVAELAATESGIFCVRE